MPIAAAAVVLVCAAVAAPVPAAHAAKTGLVHRDGQIQWVKKNGKLAKNAFRHVGGRLYYFDAQGNALRKGKVKNAWRTVKGKRYWFRGNGKAATFATGVRVIGGKFYAASDMGVYDAGLTSDLCAAAALDAEPSALLALLGAPKSERMTANCYRAPAGVAEGGKDHICTYDHVIVGVYEAPETGQRLFESYLAR